MPKQPRPEAIDAAATFLHELWDGVRPQIEQVHDEPQESGDSERPLQTIVALELVTKWDRLTQQVVRDPKRLQLKEPDILRAERALILPPLSPDESETVMPVRYSTVTVLVDQIPQGISLPLNPQRASPQVRVALTEMFRDSQRDVRNALEGILASQSEASSLTASSRLSDAEAGLLGVLAREFALTGKATFFNAREHRVWTWDLGELTVGVPISGMTVVRSGVRYGKGKDEVTRFLHPLSFDHEALDAGVLGLLGNPGEPGAIETLVRLVQKKLSK